MELDELDFTPDERIQLKNAARTMGLIVGGVIARCGRFSSRQHLKNTLALAAHVMSAELQIQINSDETVDAISMAHRLKTKGEQLNG